MSDKLKENYLNTDSRRSNADLRRYLRISACNLRPSALNLLFIILIFASGCAPILIGGAAIGGAIVIAQDSATTSVDMNFRHVWSVANSQMRKLGDVEKSFQKLGEIKGKVEGAHVTVKIARLTEKTVDITVTARKNLLPETTLAQAILTSILRNL